MMETVEDIPREAILSGLSWIGNNMLSIRILFQKTDVH